MASSARPPEPVRPFRGRRLLAGLMAGSLLAMSATAGAEAADCRGHVYLTIDTGTMVPADFIADALARRHIKATFFIADEMTGNGKTALDPGYAAFWRRLAADGHAFGTHTTRHWYLRGDTADGHIRYVKWGGGEQTLLDHDGFCRELRGSAEKFKAMTGHQMQPLWRAPGGYLTALARKWAPECGFTRHVTWSDTGFLGDELPSDKYPNAQLLKQALGHIRDGDVLMMHLGIRSRQDPFVNVLEPLLDGLTAKGLCFDTVAETRPANIVNSHDLQQQAAGDRALLGAGDRALPGAGDRALPGAGDRALPGKAGAPK